MAGASASGTFQRKLLSLTTFCKDVEIADKAITLGRGEACSSRIAYAHISTAHCQISPEAEGVVVKDLGSKNGTFVNGVKLKKQSGTVLKHGDYISLTPPGDHGANTVVFIYSDDRSQRDRRSALENLVSAGDMRIIKQLGKGAFGEVFLGVVNREERAIKVVHKGASGPSLYREIQVMDRLRHPNIVRIHEVLDIGAQLCMTLDYASGGDLEGLLRRLGPIGESDAACFLVQVFGALSYLHGENVIHRDLKPENILVKHSVKSGEAPHLMLSDFGLATLLANTPMARATTVCGTPVYAAPEIVLADRAASSGAAVEPYDARVDVWSAGVLLFRMLCAKLPWSSNPQLGLAEQILAAADPARPVRIDGVPISRACRHFLESLLVRKDERLSAAGALKQEWFVGRGGQTPQSINPSQTQMLMESPDDDMELGSTRKRLHDTATPAIKRSRPDRSKPIVN